MVILLEMTAINAEKITTYGAAVLRVTGSATTQGLSRSGQIAR